MRDLEKLASDWASDPVLHHCAYDKVEDLAEALIKCHQYLISPEGGLAGYLYQQQVRRVKELQEELKRVRQQQANRR